ncbi:MAG: FAD-dependent oxidoreductase [Acidobacteriota bacterium]|jgi:predicted NAD/FAD-binding protein
MSDAGREGLSIAVVGAGAAGMTAAWLLQRRHHVTLFERESAPGGHVKTIHVPDGPDAGTPVDTGFIVFNDDNYPLFNRLLGKLGVASRYSDMSFSYFAEDSGLQYAGTGLNGLFAQRSNLVRPEFWKLLRGIQRFCHEAQERIATGSLNGDSLGQFLHSAGLHGMVADDYVLPLAAAIWSASRDDIRAFPAASLLRFFDNHGLLRLRERPRWKTIVGGSRTYVDRLVGGFEGEVETGNEVRGVRRNDNGVEVRRADGSTRRFDRVVLAVHADQALRLLEDPRAEEGEALGTWHYNPSVACLHTDDALMPPLRRAWASWNYRRGRASAENAPVSVTYHMNRLQGLRSRAQFFVSLNAESAIDDERIITRIPYSHPCFSKVAMDSQPKIASMSGTDNTYYCGSYLGYGFHEDAVRSGAAVASKFGIEL